MQDAYAQSFDCADIVVLAPPYDQSRIPQEERLDITSLLQAIRARGKEAFVFGTKPENAQEWSASSSAQSIAQSILPQLMPYDVIAILSNGGFGGLHQKILHGIPSAIEDAK